MLVDSLHCTLSDEVMHTSTVHVQEHSKSHDVPVRYLILDSLI